MASGGNGYRLDRRLPNRQVDEPGRGGQCHVGVPHPLIIAEMRDREPAEIGAEEPANLVRQQRKAEQRREIADAEELADDRGRRRNGGRAR